MNFTTRSLRSLESTEDTEEESKTVTGKIIGAAIDIHRALGPGLLESAYETCLIYELRLRKLKVELQKSIPIFYKDVILDCGYRADLIVEDQVIVEIKSVSNLASIHEAQLLSYLKLSGCKIGLLINFNVKYLKEGIRRMKS
ncbi:MAG: GxxExxY protein [Rhabdochlamydiaceae bacterium]